MARAASDEAASRFEGLYRACYASLLGYVLRRTDRPDSAADVVAETFLVAWRRLDEIPPDRARPWLFGVARRVLANHHRGVRRTAELAARLREELAHSTPERGDVPVEVSRAFRMLPEADQELLRLIAWEELTTEELAVALECSVNAVRVRLHRARRRFAEVLREPTLTL